MRLLRSGRDRQPPASSDRAYEQMVLSLGLCRKQRKGRRAVACRRISDPIRSPHRKNAGQSSRPVDTRTGGSSCPGQRPPSSGAGDAPRHGTLCTAHWPPLAPSRNELRWNLGQPTAAHTSCCPGWGWWRVGLCLSQMRHTTWVLGGGSHTQLALLSGTLGWLRHEGDRRRLDAEWSAAVEDRGYIDRLHPAS